VPHPCHTPVAFVAVWPPRLDPDFETEEADEFREPGYSKERRLEPQVTIGLLTGQDASL